MGPRDDWELRLWACMVMGLRSRVARRSRRAGRRLWLEDVGGREHVVTWQVEWLVKNDVGRDSVCSGESGSGGNEGCVCMSR